MQFTLETNMLKAIEEGHVGGVASLIKEGFHPDSYLVTPKFQGYINPIIYTVGLALLSKVQHTAIKKPLDEVKANQIVELFAYKGACQGGSWDPNNFVSQIKNFMFEAELTRNISNKLIFQYEMSVKMLQVLKNIKKANELQKLVFFFGFQDPNSPLSHLPIEIRDLIVSQQT